MPFNQETIQKQPKMPSRAENIVRHMMDNDDFSQWLKIQVEHAEPGHVVLSATVRDEMTNGFKIAHGGISYSLADSALAFASNGYGPMAVSIETSISHTRPVFSGDKLKATCKELNRSKSIGIYEVTVVNQNDKTVGIFKGTVFIKAEEWQIQ